MVNKIFLLIAVLVSSLPIVAQTEIHSQSDLLKISENLNGSYKLMNDITLSGKWIPIKGFEGTLDGNGHIISNLNISEISRNDVGFFGTTNKAVIRHLGIRNANVLGGSSTENGNKVGILVGEAKETVIEYCYIKDSKVTGREYVGSFVGVFTHGETLRNRLANSYSNVDVIAYSSLAGGLVGGTDMTDIINCYYLGTVYSKGTGGIAGGIVGVATGDTTKISGSMALGTYVRAVTASRIVGKKDELAILNLQLNYARTDMKIGYTDSEMKVVPANQALVNNQNGSNIATDSEEHISIYPDYTVDDVTKAWKNFIYYYQDACTTKQIFSLMPRVNATNKSNLAAIWIQAIYWDMAMNRFRLTNNAVDKQFFDTLYSGNYNHYVKFDFQDSNQETGWFIYDDIMWWTVALTRAYEYFITDRSAADKYLKYAESSYDRVLFGSERVGDPGSWDQVKGGMFWNWSKPSGAGWDKRDNGKAACINFPTVIAATALYQLTGKESYKTQAKIIYDWARANLIRNDGYVFDMYHSKSGGHDNLYNSGVAIGAAVGMYKLTGGREYLNDAILIADYVKNVKCAATSGFLPVRYGEEQSIYAAIFVQYMVRLIEDCGQCQYLPWLRYNINSGWGNRNQNNITCPDFKTKLNSTMTWDNVDGGVTKTRVIKSYDASAIPAMMLIIPPIKDTDIKSNLKSVDFYAKGLKWDMDNIWIMSSEGLPVFKH